MDAAVDSCALRALYGEPSELAVKKELTQLDRHCRAFIALSPFLVIGSAAADGSADVSPRGDAPGFVQVRDDRTLVLPDRVGNRRIDTLRNIAENPNVALIFFVPGIAETLRVNGKAAVTTDPAVLAPLAAQGKLPVSALVVTIEQAFLQCAKALIRSKLWDASAQVDRKVLPPLGTIIADQASGKAGAAPVDPVKAEALVQEGYRTRLY